MRVFHVPRLGSLLEAEGSRELPFLLSCDLVGTNWSSDFSLERGLKFKAPSCLSAPLSWAVNGLSFTAVRGRSSGSVDRCWPTFIAGPPAWYVPFGLDLDLSWLERLLGSA